MEAGRTRTVCTENAILLKNRSSLFTAATPNTRYVIRAGGYHGTVHKIIIIIIIKLIIT